MLVFFLKIILTICYNINVGVYMKKVVTFIILLFVFILPVKADLTKQQENDIAAFAANFIIEGNKRVDKNGYPLLAYMQGQARIDGYQSKLYKVKYDYNHKNYVNEKKWTFDCASYVSFVYYHTFGLVLTYSKTSKIDSYSGLTIRNAIANPYQVSAFVDDANRSEHFYYIKKGITGSNINFDELEKGDLIIYVGHHIMIYVGEGKIAEATTSSISKTNLGTQVIPLISKYSNISLSIIRLKNKIIPENAVANTKVTWLDTGETVDLVRNEPTKEEYPKIEYKKSSDDWTKELEIEFKLTATNGLENYSFSNGNDNWIDLSGQTYSFKKNITKNGTYLLKVVDAKGLKKEESITISTIDSTKPIIKSLSSIQNDSYSTIKVVAEDNESGLADNAYSYDKGLTWTSKSTYDVYIEKEYTIYVKDKAGNISTLPIVVKINGSTGNKPIISDIIHGNFENNTRKITIVVLNCHNCKIVVEKSTVNPTNDDNWKDLDGNNYITYLTAGSYNIWLKDSKGNIITKSFSVEIPRQNNFEIIIIIGIISVILVIVGVFLMSRKKASEV